LNLTELNRVKNLSWDYTSDPRTIRERQGMVSLEEIFQFTPSTEGSIDGCKFPSPVSFDLLFSRNCISDNNFTVEKFYTQEFICYHIKFRDKRTFRFEDISNALNVGGMIFSLDFSEEFKTADKIKIIVVQKILPFLSKFFAPTFSRAYDYQTQEAMYSMFRISYTIIDVTKLPPPYKTKCNLNNKIPLAGICKSNCLLEKVTKEMNRVPFQSIVLDPYPLMHISFKDIKNREKRETFNKLVDFCSQKCNYQDCKNDFTMTYVFKEERSPRDRLRIQLEAPRSPQLKLEYEPKSTFHEYSIYVSSSLGIWFGLSIFSLNPFKPGFYFGTETHHHHYHLKLRSSRVVPLN